MNSLVTIKNDHWHVGLVPETGGSIAFGQVALAGAWVDVMRPTAPEDLDSAPDCASYPLVPWCNRIRKGVLKWQGRDYQLRVNFPDGTAIHGTGMEYPWNIVVQEADRTVLEFNSATVDDPNFPWTFKARFEYLLDDERFTCRMTLTNTDAEAFPAGFGHHPYFVRSLTAGDGASLGDEAHLQINCEKGYELDDLMAIGPAGEIPARANYHQMRPVGNDFVDDCLAERTSKVAATINYPGALTVDMEAQDLLEHVVVYVPPGEQFFALEPVSNANDAFTLNDAGLTKAGVFVVEPGESRTAEFSFVARPQ